MQNLFNVTAIDTDYTNKQMIVRTTFSVNPETVNKKNIEVVSASSGAAVIYKLSVDDDKIIVTLKDWPEVDGGYYVVKIVGIKDKLNRDLIHPITKNVMFKADTKLKIIILNPNNNEAVVKQHNVVNFSIKQINPDGSETVKPLPGSGETPLLPNEEIGKKEVMLEEELDVTYHFEFASDIAFFDIVKDYSTSYTEGFIQLDNGQYYMRARAIEGDMHGDWSPVHTFTVVPDVCYEELDELSQAKKDYIDEIMAPVEFFLNDEEDLFEIISRSNNGQTYPEFYIEFSQDIDADKLPDSIIAYRRDL